MPLSGNPPRSLCALRRAADWEHQRWKKLFQIFLKSHIPIKRGEVHKKSFEGFGRSRNVCVGVTAAHPLAKEKTQQWGRSFTTWTLLCFSICIVWCAWVCMSARGGSWHALLAFHGKLGPLAEATWDAQRRDVSRLSFTKGCTCTTSTCAVSF